MRILMLTQFYSPIIGGIERHVQDLCTELAARGHDISVVTLWQKGLSEFEVQNRIRVYRVRGTVHRAAKILFQDPRRSYAPPFPDPELTIALRRIIAREQPQIVHAHNWLVHSILPLKHWSEARLVVTLHDYGLRCPKWTFFHNGMPCSGPGFRKCVGCLHNHYGLVKGGAILLCNRIMSQVERNVVDMFVPVSQAVAVGSGLVDSQLPFQVIPNFISGDVNVPNGDVEDYCSQLPSEGYLLFVGAFGRHKGVDVLLCSYRGLNSRLPLVLIGYEVAESAQLLTDLPPNVIVFKNWPHKAVMNAWKQCSLALIPSACPDSCPTTAIEAMVCGTPVIASKVGGLPDLVDNGETGILVPPGDPDRLREAIERLLSDSDLRKRMGQNGKRKAADFQAKTVVSRVEQVYQSLTDG